MPLRLKRIYRLLNVVINIMAFLVFGAGLVLALLGIYEWATAFTHFNENIHHIPGLIGITLLKGVDLFLLAIVFFVFSLGLLLLFNYTEEELPVQLPKWLRIKNFIELKVILWEAILTTLVISYLAKLVELKMEGIEYNVHHLIIPAAILIIAISLFFLKKGEH